MTKENFDKAATIQEKLRRIEFQRSLLFSSLATDREENDVFSEFRQEISEFLTKMRVRADEKRRQLEKEFEAI